MGDPRLRLTVRNLLDRNLQLKDQSLRTVQGHLSVTVDDPAATLIFDLRGATPESVVAEAEGAARFLVSSSINADHPKNAVQPEGIIPQGEAPDFSNIRFRLLDIWHYGNSGTRLMPAHIVEMAAAGRYLKLQRTHGSAPGRITLHAR